MHSLVAIALTLLAGCPANPESLIDGAIPDASPENDADPTGCTSDVDCDDTIDCTVDVCIPSADTCQHAPTPMRCAPGETCDPAAGCEPGRPCANDFDCRDDGDPCSVDERCDPAARVCVWRAFDGDGDGFPPPSCGGTDCDDGSSAIHPGAAERCGPVDQDCDGVGAEGGLCHRGDLVCVDETCRCSAGELECSDGFSVRCVGVADDPANCGGCGRACAGTCAGGVCSCADGLTWCGSSCIDTSLNTANCGRCGHACATGQECLSGSCAACGGIGEPCCASASEPARCPSGTCGPSGICVRCGEADGDPCCPFSGCVTTDPPEFGLSCGVDGLCSCPDLLPDWCGGCTDVRYDRFNCGGCGRDCEGTCTDGVCTGCGVGETWCSSYCANTSTDPNNCGACFNTCPLARRTCAGGRCV